jgi:hypothetical protein
MFELVDRRRNNLICMRTFFKFKDFHEDNFKSVQYYVKTVPLIRTCVLLGRPVYIKIHIHLREALMDEGC